MNNNKKSHTNVGISTKETMEQLFNKKNWILGAWKTSAESSSPVKVGTSSCSFTRLVRRDAPIPIGKWPR